MKECYNSGLSLRMCRLIKCHTQRKRLYIKIDNKTIFFLTCNWFYKGVKTLNKLLNLNLDFLTYEESKLRYRLQTNFLTYSGVINAISQEYKRAIRQTGVQQGHLTQPWQNLKVPTTKVIHKSFVRQIFEEPPKNIASLSMG